MFREIRMVLCVLLLGMCGCGTLGFVNNEQWRTNKLDPETTIEVDMGRGKAKFHSTQEGDFAIDKAGYDEATQRWVLEGLRYKRMSVGVMDADARRMVYVLEGYGMDHATARKVADNLLAFGLRGLDSFDKGIEVLFPGGLAALKAAGVSQNVLGGLIGDLLKDPAIREIMLDRIKDEIARQAGATAESQPVVLPAP